MIKKLDPNPPLIFTNTIINNSNNNNSNNNNNYNSINNS